VLKLSAIVSVLLTVSNTYQLL